MTKHLIPLILLALAPVHAFADTLSLDSYLSEVREKHDGLRGSILARDGAQMDSDAARLLVMPTLVANAQLLTDDAQNPLFGLESETQNTYSLGISQTTTFGMQATLNYTLTYQSLDFLPSALRPPVAYNQGRPLLQITQSLWRNGFGSETRATIQAQQAQALANSFSQSYQGRQILSQAEIAYWNLALYRSAVSITKTELERAQALYDVNTRKAKLGLADESDRLQAEAQLKLRKLQLQSAQDSERSAAQTFNQLRGVIAPSVSEKVQELESDKIIKVEVPARAKMREDVRAAMEQSRASEANAQLGREKATPTFEVYGAIGPAAEELSPGSTITHSLELKQLEREAGFRLSIPLNLGLASSSREGFAKEQAGADLIYQRKLFEQENDWDDLNRRLSESKTQLELSRAVELVQKDKLRVERERLNRGRTTTFNVIQFEQDYLQAQLSVVQAQAQVLTIIAQMKTFGGPI